MNEIPYSRSCLQWPVVDTASKGVEPAFCFRVRNFAVEYCDLQVDFNNPPALVAAHVLSCCLLKTNNTPYQIQDILNWSIKKRLQALIAVYVTGFGDELEIGVCCDDPGCAEELELRLPLQSCTDLDGDEHFVHQIDGHVLQVHLPTGVDQMSWLELRGHSSLFSSMAITLVDKVDGEIPDANFRLSDEQLATLGSELESRDPLTALEIETRCVTCDKTVSAAVDLELNILKLLEKLQNQLIEQVHILASAYHWSERDIMQLGSVRRQKYLSKLEQGWVSL